MGLFDGNTKKGLEEAYIKIEELNQKIGFINKDLEESKFNLLTSQTEQRSLELDKKALEIEINKYKDLLSDDVGIIKISKERLQELQFKIKESTTILAYTLAQLDTAKTKLDILIQQHIVMDEAVLLQSFGLYTPKYSFAESSMYKDRLSEVREKQSQMIKSETAAFCLKIWSVEGSAIKGKQLIEDNIKQILRTFNTECDNVIQSVKFSNYDASKKRILKSYETLNKLNTINKIGIHDEYLKLKYQELDLAFEYAQKLQEEKEEMRQQRELKKEEMRLAKELEEKRAEVEKEQQHYLNAVQRLKQQIECEKNEEHLKVLIQRENEIMQNLADVETVLKDLDYREANQRAGYVYIISNIGAFGENIYKIGMTRRLDPQERIDELGGASVPFRFDIHAMIFCNDAPKLETALHKAFEDKKLNAVNGRKEFFNVTLEEIEAVFKLNHDKSVDFIKYPKAQQYRESLRMKS